MEPLGLWLVALGAADLVGDFSGRPQGARATASIFVGTGLAAFTAALLGYSVAATVQLGVAIAVCLAAWVTLRRRPPWSPRQAAVALVVLILATWGFAFLAVNVWQPDGGHLAGWFRDLPYGWASEELDRVLVTVGAGLAMLATGNAVVRLVLATLKENFDAAESSLRGGRVIGAFERLLVLGLAVSGEIEAAIIVVSAKSLLRFPELNSKRSDGRAEAGNGSLDTITEYFLVGSMTSWVVALVPALFLV